MPHGPDGRRTTDSCRNQFVKLVTFTGVVVATLVALIRRR